MVNPLTTPAMTFNQKLVFSLEDLAAYESRPFRVVKLMLPIGEKPYFSNFFIYEPRNPQGYEDWEDPIISARTKKDKMLTGERSYFREGKNVNLPCLLPERVIFWTQKSEYCRSSG